MKALNDTILLFDGVCHLCAGSVQFILKRDAKKTLKFASLQSDLGRRLLEESGLPSNDLSSLVLFEQGKAWTKSNAALRIARHLRAPWPTLAVFWIVPRPIRDVVYDLIARNRYRWFGKEESCWIPRPEWRSRFLDQTSKDSTPAA